MPEEIELKLSIPRNRTKRLGKRLPLRNFKVSGPSSRRLVSVYFDTPDLDLRRRGVGLRVRHVDGRRIQTIKCAGDSPIGRFECEEQIESDRPDLTCVAEAGLQALFADIGAPRRLKSLFATEIDRTAWQLNPDGAAIECALDRGTIRAGGRRLPVREVELELKAGEPAALFDTANALHQKMPLRIEWETKGQRGYALAAGFVPEPRSWEAPRLSKKMDVRDALGAIVDGCIGQIVANERSVRRQDNAEGVHKMRVGVRRLRSALSTFRRALPGDGRMPFEGDLRWLQDVLGHAREWDVLHESGLDPLTRETKGNGDIRTLKHATTSQRAAAYKTLHAALDSPRYTALFLATMRWRHELSAERGGALEASIRIYARRELRRRSKGVRKLGRRLGELSGAELHRLRIRVKKLRYAMEFFHDLFAARRVDKHLARLTRLQDVLGDLNDARVAPRLVDGLRAKRASASADPRLARGEGLVKGWMAARAAADRGLIQRRWAKYEKARAACWL
jgi:triphosphatase